MYSAKYFDDPPDNTFSRKPTSQLGHSERYRQTNPERNRERTSGGHANRSSNLIEQNRPTPRHPSRSVHCNETYKEDWTVITHSDHPSGSETNSAQQCPNEITSNSKHSSSYTSSNLNMEHSNFAEMREARNERSLVDDRPHDDTCGSTHRHANEAQESTPSTYDSPEIFAGDIYVEQQAPTASGRLSGEFPDVKHSQLRGETIDEDSHPSSLSSDLRNSPENSKSGNILTNVARSLFSSGSRSASPPKDKLIEQNNELKGALKELGEKYNKLRGRHGLLKGNHGKLENLYRELQDELTGVRYQLEQSEQALQDCRILADTRGKELLGAQVFLTKADSLSVSDIIQKVQVLNEEIFQMAASLGEHIVHRAFNFPDNDAYKECLSIASKALGENMIDMLQCQARASVPEINPLLAQAALSIILTSFCVVNLNCWYLPDYKTAGFLESTYNAIKSSEENAVSGRWRAITRQYTRKPSNGLQIALLHKLDKIFKICSWHISPEKRVSFEQKLPPFFSAMDDLIISAGEKFTSADLQVYTVKLRTVYDHTCMEDAYGDVRQSVSDQECPGFVAGTTAMGLRKIIGVPRPSTGAVEEQSENVHPPKVVLESTLREALEPPIPRASRKTRRS